jgi:hypothetical protein
MIFYFGIFLLKSNNFIYFEKKIKKKFLLKSKEFIIFFILKN